MGLHSHPVGSIVFVSLILTVLLVCLPLQTSAIAFRESDGLHRSSISSLNHEKALKEAFVAKFEQLNLPPELTNSTCIKQYLFLLRNNTSLLFRLFDSSGVMPSGILEGNFKALGNFEECNELYPQDAHYCLLSFPLSMKASNQTNNQTVGRTPGLSLTLGLCIPSQCTADDELGALVTLLERLSVFTGGQVVIDKNSTSAVCLPPHPELDSYGVAGIVVLSVMGLVVLLSTAVHYYYPDGKMFASSSTPADTQTLLNENQTKAPVVHAKLFLAVRSFSLLYNLPRLLDAGGRGQMTALNGVRVISICWVILCHTLGWFAADITDVLRAFKSLSNFMMQIISNGWSSVDTFFFLSGFLVAFIAIKELKKKGRIPWFLFYFHRIWRLTPVYMFVLFLTITVVPLWLRGPNSILPVSEADLCKRYWWTNLLYINNFYPHNADSGCVGVSWYLANDMQMFIVSPLFFFTFYKSKLLGWIVMALGLMANIISSAIIAHKEGHLGNMIVELNMGSKTVMDHLYVKPWIRIGAYLMGISMAFIYHQLLEHQQAKSLSLNSDPNENGDHQNNSKKENEYAVPFPRYVSYGLMLFGGFWMCLIVFGTYTESTPYDWSNAKNVLFISFSRLIWCFGLGCLLLMCLTGNGGWVNSFLSLPIFNVLSKLTFGAYLLHIIILNTLFRSYSGTFVYDEFLLVTLFLGVTCISFFASLVLALLLEMPIVNLEKLFLPAH